MSELNYIPEIDTDEYGQPVSEILPFREFRSTYSWECASASLSAEVMRNFYSARGLPMPGKRIERDAKILAPCGKEIVPKNLRTHTQHCPKCLVINE